MFLRGKTRIGAAALLAVLAMALAAPAGAAPWGGFGEARELVGGFLPRVLAWLGVGSDQNVALRKCDDGATIDPNGCPKAARKILPASGMRKCDQGSTIDPNGCPKGTGNVLPASGTRSDGGLRAAPAHRR